MRVLQKQENPHLNSPLPLIIVPFGFVPFQKVVARHRKSSEEAGGGGGSLPAPALGLTLD